MLSIPFYTFKPAGVLKLKIIVTGYKIINKYSPDHPQPGKYKCCAVETLNKEYT
jgi:hypothetical protein